MRNKTLALFVTLVAVVGIAFGATMSRLNITRSVINSTSLGLTTPDAVNATTFQLNGTAPTGHQLCGDGTHYIDCTTAAAPAETQPSRSYGTVYQNTGSTVRFVYGYGTISGGSGDSQMSCLTGPHGGSLTTRWGTTTTGTLSGEQVPFECNVPPTYDYEVNKTNIISSTPGSWSELQ